MKKFLLSLLLLTLAAPAWAGDDKDKESAYERVMKTGTIRCGYFIWPPGFSIDPNTGAKTGVFYDIIEELGKRLDLKIEWSQELNFGTYLQDLDAGKYDMECTGGWPTATRGKFVSYSDNLFYLPLVAVVRADETRFRDKKQMNSANFTVATIDGEFGQIIKRQQFPLAKELGLPQNSPTTDMVISVMTKKADVAFTDIMSAQKFLKQNPGKMKILWQDSPVKLIPQSFTMKSEESRFRDMINKATEEMLLDGTIDRILDRYEGVDHIFMRVALPYRTGK